VLWLAASHYIHHTALSILCALVSSSHNFCKRRFWAPWHQNTCIHHHPRIFSCRQVYQDFHFFLQAHGNLSQWHNSIHFQSDLISLFMHDLPPFDYSSLNFHGSLYVSPPPALLLLSSATVGKDPLLFYFVRQGVDILQHFLTWLFTFGGIIIQYSIVCS